MEYIYVVFVFSLMLVDLAVMYVGGWLFPLVLGLFSAIVGAVAMGSTISAEIPFAPYPQAMLAAVGVLSLFVSAWRYKHPF